MINNTFEVKNEDDPMCTHPQVLNANEIEKLINTDIEALQTTCTSMKC